MEVKYNTLLLANMQTALKKSETEVKEILVRDLLSLKEALDRKLTTKTTLSAPQKHTNSLMGKNIECTFTHGDIELVNDAYTLVRCL
jgi:hypothetical protein